MNPIAKICSAPWMLGLWLVGSAIAHSEISSAAPAPSMAQDDLLCYFQTGNGQLINLSKLCGSNDSTPRISSIDQQFLKTYQGFLSKRSPGLPSVAAALSQAQQSPQTVIARAKRICSDLQSGALTQEQLPQTAVDADLINSMAVEYYCPELDD